MFEVHSSMMISSIRPARKGRWRPHFPAKISGKSAAQSGCKQAVALETPSTSHSREKKSLRPWGYFLPSLSIPGKKRSIVEESNEAGTTAIRYCAFHLPLSNGDRARQQRVKKTNGGRGAKKRILHNAERGRERYKKHGRSRGAWVAGAVSQPANSGAISQHPVFRAAAS